MTMPATSGAYRLETTANFEREFHRLDRTVARRVMRTIDQIAAHPELMTQPLRNPPRDLEGIHKYRVGDYRVLLWVDRKNHVITLHTVGHRSEVYRNL
jgi:mRNA interferase RelE/StbE